MAHTLHEHLDLLTERIARMTAGVQQIVEDAARSVFDADVALARSVIAADLKIDAEEVEIERTAIDLLALHQPAAGDLRLLTSIIKANNDFERIADSAVNVAQRVVPLANEAAGLDGRPGHPGHLGADGRAHATGADLPDLRVMVNGVVELLRDTIRAFNTADEPLARAVLRGDDVVDALYHQVLQDLIARMAADGTRANRDLAMVMIAKNFERIGDHCTNVAEDIIYTRSGKIIRHTHAG